MKINEILTEIDYADDIQSISAALSNLGQEIGQVNGLDVYFYKDSLAMYYSLRKDDGIIAYVALSNSTIDGRYALHQFENVTKIPGAITTLLMYITRKLGKKLIFLPSEKLTEKGLEWIIKTISAGGRGFTITDQNFNSIDITKLTQEWEAAKNADYRPTAIFVEHTSPRFDTIFEQWDGLLQPAIVILGDERLL